jgi:excisionase family DNA binding protein
MAVAKNEHLLTPSEVAALFRVDPKTVTRWAQAGKLSSIRTLGGHRRFNSDEIRKLLGESRQAGSIDVIDPQGSIVDLREEVAIDR